MVPQGFATFLGRLINIKKIKKWPIKDNLLKLPNNGLQGASYLRTFRELSISAYILGSSKLVAVIPIALELGRSL